MLVQETNKLFPVFLKLEQLSILIVGGGNVGLEKLSAVLNNSPLTKIRLVATSIDEAIKELAIDHPNIQLDERPFEESDVDGADIVIIGINDKSKSEEIALVA